MMKRKGLRFCSGYEQKDRGEVEEASVRSDSSTEWRSRSGRVGLASRGSGLGRGW